MEPSTRVALAIIFLILSVIAVILNLILFVLARKLGHIRWEMKFVAILTIVDMIMSMISIIMSIKFILTGEMVADNWCYVKGPADYLGLFFSMLIVSLIALERSNQIFQVQFSRLLGILLLLYCIFYVGLVMTINYKGEFHALPNGMDCGPNSQVSELSSISTFLLGFTLLGSLIVTVICYFQILLFVIRTRHLNDPVTSSPWLNKYPVMIRTLVISCSYIILITPAGILLIMDSKTVLGEIELNIIDICLASVTLINPCLVLFIHSAIYQILSDYLYRFRERWYLLYDYSKSREFA